LTLDSSGRPDSPGTPDAPSLSGPANDVRGASVGVSPDDPSAVGVDAELGFGPVGPGGDPPAEVPPWLVYRIKAVVWATFFGSVLGGGVILAVNYGRLGRPRARVVALVLTALATLGVCRIAVALPGGHPLLEVVFTGVQLVAMYLISRGLQGNAIDSNPGGRFVSTWWAVGIGLLCGLLVVVGIVGVSMLAKDGAGPDGSVVRLNTADEVYYSGDATRGDAQYLGKELTSAGYFGHSGGAVWVTADGGVYTVSFALKDGTWGDAAILAAFRQFGVRVADARFGRPLVVELCDSNMAAHRTLHIK
jgi:hypothetical protein